MHDMLTFEHFGQQHPISLIIENFQKLMAGPKRFETFEYFKIP